MRAMVLTLCKWVYVSVSVYVRVKWNQHTEMKADLIELYTGLSFIG